MFSKHKIDSSDVKNGSLVFEDFKSGEIVSSDLFVKYKKQITDFKQDVKGDVAGIKIQQTSIKGELGDIKTSVDSVKGDVASIKGELSSYLKNADADARYLKVTDAVVRGDGSVFTATTPASGQNPVPILSVPGLIAVDALPAEQQIRIKNVGGNALAYSQCVGLQSGGVLAPNQSVNCAVDDETDVMQLIGVSSPEMVTLNFTFFPAIQAGSGLYTTQILVGL